MNAPYGPHQWRHLVPNIDEVVREMDQTPIVAVGITPYTRLIPSFFLKNFSIYTIRHSSDVDVMREYMKVHAFEDYYPKLADKIHGTGYLLGNFGFQNFLKSQKKAPKLLFYTMTERIVKDLAEKKIAWIGNDPETCKEVMFKGSFRALVRSKGLPSLDSVVYPREVFEAASFEQLQEEHSGAFVVQRADKEVGGNEGTFFIHTSQNFTECLAILGKDDSFHEIVVTPFIKGQSTSMLGCVLPQGILSGPLQLQLIDVPEALHTVPPNGIFFGNDLGYHPWGDHIERQAQKVVEAVGEHLRERGYKGIFGIDFLYDEARDQIYPNECNPRFTGSLVLYSLMLLENNVPPLEFFHIATHLGLEPEFNFEEMNDLLKVRIPCAHIAISPKDIPCMELPLLAGVYEYDASIPELSYKGPGITLKDLTNENQFMLIDTVPALHGKIEQAVPRLFKFIFPRSIAKSSYEIDAAAGFLLERFSTSLIAASREK